tara:strand:- start:391 stop:966 length:576 start_codon:yes stop_codon:yes gene_type:complete
LRYLLSSSELRTDFLKINSSNLKNESSVKNLLDNDFYNLKLSDLLSGEFSMGTQLTPKGHESVPSKDCIAPKEGELYFSGRYNTEEYGSKGNGSVDAIQVELNMNGIRDTEENKTVFSKNFMGIIIIFFKKLITLVSLNVKVVNLNVFGRHIYKLRIVKYLGWESNPHSRKNWILNPARLPVPPPRQVKYF